MNRKVKALIMLAGAATAAGMLGFIVFASFALRDRDANEHRADGIVVLTGAEMRIAEGARLLRDGRATRLLISGVNPRVSRADLLRITGLPAQQLDCCVDVGRNAADTIGNAAEAREWMHRHNYRSVILVTSSYHMPRSLIEFARVLPAVEVVPHAVVPRSFPDESWWLHPGVARILLSEYVKFLPAVLRLATVRMFGDWDTSAIADGGAARVGAAGGL